MKRLRIAVLVVGSLALAVLAFFWTPRSKGFATPEECIDACREASLAGDAGQFLRCLGEPLHSDMRQRFPDATVLGETLRGQMKDVTSWSQVLEPLVTGPTAFVDVDEIRVTGTRRTRFRLERASRGWLIVAIGAPQEIPTPVPYGTHVSRVPEGAGKAEVP
jgi:hypothetical protein